MAAWPRRDPTYKKLRGATDEATPLLRLADMVAGFLRLALAGKADIEALKHRLETKGIVKELP